MSRLNPNTPDTSGIEWLPTRAFTVPLKVGDGTGVEMTSTAGETIAEVLPRISAAGSAHVGMDIYDASSLWAAGDVVGGAESPSSDTINTAGWEQSTDAGATFAPLTANTAHTYLDKIIPDSFAPIDILNIVTSTGLVIRYLPSGSQTEGHLMCLGHGTYFKITDASLGNDPTGNRVGWIEVNVACKAINGASPTVDGWMNIGGTNYGSDDGPRRITPHWTRQTWHFYTNPSTGRQWTSAEIADFITGAGTPYGFGFSVRGPAGTDYQFAALNVVFRSLPERRVATGYGIATGDAFCSIPTLAPADHSVASWAKGNGTTYLALFYLTGTGGNAALVAMDEATLAETPAGTLTGWLGAVVATAQSSNAPNADPALATYAPALYMRTSAPATGVDGQPYHIAGTQPITVASGTNTDSPTAGASAAYGIVNAVVAKLDASGNVTNPTQNLEIDLDSANGEITAADIPADGRFHLFAVRLTSSPSLSGGTPYPIGFSSADTQAWSVALIGCDTADALSLLIDQAAVKDSVGFNNLNFLVNMATVPTAPSGLTAVVVSGPLTPPPPGGPATIDAAQLGWNATALGAAFGYYEIARSTDGGPLVDLVRIGDEATVSFVDYEVLPGSVESYQIRVVRTDGAVSDWAT